MDIKRLKRRKKMLGYTNEEVAARSGVPLGTVQKVMGETTKNPRRDTVLALARVLDPDMACDMDDERMAERMKEERNIERNNREWTVRGSEMAYSMDNADSKGDEKSNNDEALDEASMDISQSGFRNGSLRKNQGEYTLEDYYALPDEQRVELIDGVIYDMTAPRKSHQVIVGEIHRQLSNCAIEHDMEWFPMVAPVDVQLDKDNKTMVQPDVLITCEKEKMKKSVIFGAPEFMTEVLSQSTRNKDQIVKLGKYQRAGVKEYWIVDLKKERVTVYEFEKEEWPEIYSFNDIVPVGISDGLCEIDFNMIRNRLEKFVQITGEEL